MRRACLVVLLLFPTLAASSSVPDERPLDLRIREKTEISLTLVDAVVVDARGRTVPGLTLGDFEIKVDSKVLLPVSLDLRCPAGGLDEPRVRTAIPPGSDPRRIILTFDYQHLSPMQRMEVLDLVRDTIRRRMGPTDQIMVVALTGGLRVLLPFSSSREDAIRTLDAMQRDVDLYAGNFFHPDETGFVDALTALFDTVGALAAPKALVLFSAMEDVPLDWQFRRLASFAASARVTVYPVDVRGLVALEPIEVGPAIKGNPLNEVDSGISGVLFRERRAEYTSPTPPSQFG